MAVVVFAMNEIYVKAMNQSMGLDPTRHTRPYIDITAGSLMEQRVDQDGVTYISYQHPRWYRKAVSHQYLPPFQTHVLMF